jgi:hypothetical protein
MSMPERPTIYNRPWHLDADERRHHGRREWEASAIEAFVELLSTIDGLYPPDWSERDVARFRAVGASEPFAELWTDKASSLRLVFHVSPPAKLAIEGCRIHGNNERCEVLLKTPAPINAPAFANLVRQAVAQAAEHSRRA